MLEYPQPSFQNHLPIRLWACVCACTDMWQHISPSPHSFQPTSPTTDHAFKSVSFLAGKGTFSSACMAQWWHHFIQIAAVSTGDLRLWRQRPKSKQFKLPSLVSPCLINAFPHLTQYLCHLRVLTENPFYQKFGCFLLHPEVLSDLPCQTHYLTKCLYSNKD